MALNQVEQKFLAAHRLGRLATIGPDGGPQVKPVGVAYNEELGTLDIYGFNMAQSAKYRNVERQPLVALEVDNPAGVGAEAQFLEIRGMAETFSWRTCARNCSSCSRCSSGLGGSDT